MTFKTVQQHEKALRSLLKLKRVVSRCETSYENTTEHMNLLLEKIENKRKENRDLVRDREYCTEDLANLTVVTQTPG